MSLHRAVLLALFVALSGCGGNYRAAGQAIGYGLIQESYRPLYQVPPTPQFIAPQAPIALPRSCYAYGNSASCW